jgi:hypothetical protein
LLLHRLRSIILCLFVCAAKAVLATAPEAAIGLPGAWKPLAPGVKSAAAASLGGDPEWDARLVLFDPLKAHLSVQFDAMRPTLQQWRSRFPEALAIANGSFYSIDGPRREVRPTCDLVLAGKLVRGAGCRRQDALFFGVHPAPRPETLGPAESARSASCPTPAGDGSHRLLSPEEFRPGDWTEAFKSFPALVHCGAPACAGPHYCRERSRSAALAQLRDGRLVLFASQWPAVRHEVGQFFAEKLGVLEAVNLDGGPEATLALRGEAPEEAVGSAGTGLALVLVLLPGVPATPKASR